LNITGTSRSRLTASRTVRRSAAGSSSVELTNTRSGDGSGFASGANLASYAGLAPVTRQSGTSLNCETRSRRGDHRLKNAMFLAAFAALRDPASKAFYDRKRAEGKKHNAALICLARRRYDVILAMLRTRQHYQPDRSKAAAAA
jgi:transposase